MLPLSREAMALATLRTAGACVGTNPSLATVVDGNVGRLHEHLGLVGHLAARDLQQRRQETVIANARTPRRRATSH
jgi:hypothetical protein